MNEILIWFSLVMLHDGHTYWLGAWETQEECQVAQEAYEHDPAHAGDQFACPFVKVRRT